MKIKPGLLSVLVVLVAGFSLSAWAQTDSESNQPLITTGGLSGTCGFTAVSTKVDPAATHYLVPDSSVGTLAFINASQVVGNFTTNKHGTITNLGPINGTYSIDANGRTGTIDFNTLNPGAPVLKFVLTSNATELRFINVGPIDAATSIVDDVVAGVCKF